MKLLPTLLLMVACAVFVGAAASAKSWALAPTAGRMALTLGLYTLGNLIMMVLIRQIGMATAFSLSGVLQLVAINLVAILFFGERVGMVEGLGLLLAVVAVAMITLGPRFGA